MMSYNLLTEEWIPCVDLKYNKGYHSLYSFFENAHEINELALDNPLEEISVLRFLQVFVYRAYGVEKGKENWDRIWEKGKFTSEPLAKYIEDYDLHSRFNIFDSQRPFYQAKNYYKKLSDRQIENLIKAQSPVSIVTDRSSGNTGVLFDHSSDETEFHIDIRRLPVYLITAQAYALGGGGGKNRRSAMAGKIIFWLERENLFRSIMVNTFYHPKVIETGKEDNRPAWEMGNEPKASSSSYPAGLYDYLTWQSRLLCITTPEKPDEAKYYTDGDLYLKFSKKKNSFNILREQGRYYEKDTEMPFFRDPLACLIIPKDKFLELGFNKEKMIWRDLNLILNTKNKQDKPPRNLANAKNMLNEEVYQAKAYGNYNEKGKSGAFHQTKEESFRYYPAILDDHDKYEAMSDLLTLATHKSYTLTNAVKIMLILNNEESKIDMSEIFTMKSSQMMKKLEKMTTKAIDLKKAISSTKVEQNYWERLEIPFYECLEMIALKDDDDFDEIKRKWYGYVARAARESFDEYTDSAGHSAKSLRAVSLAKNYLSINLHKQWSA
jgi:CRISPR type I-E-associated protein CasA/Cse1